MEALGTGFTMGTGCALLERKQKQRCCGSSSPKEGESKGGRGGGRQEGRERKDEAPSFDDELGRRARRR